MAAVDAVVVDDGAVAVVAAAAAEAASSSFVCSGSSACWCWCRACCRGWRCFDWNWETKASTLATLLPLTSSSDRPVVELSTADWV